MLKDEGGTSPGTGPTPLKVAKNTGVSNSIAKLFIDIYESNYTARFGQEKNPNARESVCFWVSSIFGQETSIFSRISSIFVERNCVSGRHIAQCGPVHAFLRSEIHNSPSETHRTHTHTSPPKITKITPHIDVQNTVP
mgnify:CR=1 FL=1